MSDWNLLPLLLGNTRLAVEFLRSNLETEYFAVPLARLKLSNIVGCFNVWMSALENATGGSIKVDTEHITATMMFDFHDSISTITAEDLKRSSWVSLLGNVFPLKRVATRAGTSTASDEELRKFAREGFFADYQRSDVIPTSLIDFVSECLAKWDPQAYYSPYAAVINASMMGKSRMFHQLPNLGIFVVTVSFQAVKSYNVPPRTSQISDWLIAEVDTATAVYHQYLHCRFILCTLEALVAFIAGRPDERSASVLAMAWAAEQQRPEFWHAITSQIVSGASHSPNMSVEEFQRLEAEIATKTQSANASILVLMASRSPTPTHQLKVVFFFDEAAELTHGNFVVEGSTRFQILRRALRILPFGKDACTFALVTDTVSKIANFSPSQRLENSHRARANDDALFPAFYWLPTMDVWPECLWTHKVIHLQYARLYSIYGRPGLHASLRQFFRKLDVGQAEEAIILRKEQELIMMLEHKLIGSLNHTATSFEIAVATCEAALALLGVRTALTVTASCHVARKLTASHMRQCVGISKDRESVYGYQYPETALALAAARLSLRCGWKVLLDYLRQSISMTYTDGGYRGELGAQILLLMAADRAMVIAKAGSDIPWSDALQIGLNDAFLPVIPASVFLSTLLGKSAYDSLLAQEVDFEERVGKMYVRLVQFVQFFCVPDKEQVTQMFNRACGIVANPGARFVDLIIPVLIVEKGEKLEEVIVTPDRMTAILVQVKCLKNPLGAKRASRISSVKMPRTGSVFGLNPALDYLSLLIDIAPSRIGLLTRAFSRSELASKFGIGISDPNQLSVYVRGLRPSHILNEHSKDFESVDSSFQRMMNAKSDPLDLQDQSKDARFNLHKSLSLVYSKPKTKRTRVS